jgi:hypothetical protein
MKSPEDDGRRRYSDPFASDLFAGYEATVAVAYRPQLGGLAGEIRARKAEGYAFFMSTGGDFAHPVFPWPAARLTVGALALHHAGTNLTGYAAYPDFHG